MKTSQFVLTSCAAFAIAGVASAVNTVDVAGVSIPCGQNVNYSLNGGGGGYAGQIGINLTNSTGGLSDGFYISFCCEIDQHIGIPSSPTTYNQVGVDTLPNTTGGMGAASASAIARMWACAGGLQYTGDADFCAAFQVAIWEITYDGTSWDLSSGNFVATPNNAAMAADLAFLCAWAQGNGPEASLTGLGNDSNQDLIVPGPGSFALLGAAGIVGSRRRRS